MKRDAVALASLVILSGCGMDRIDVRPAGTEYSAASPAERAYQEGKDDLSSGRPGLAIVAFETALANDPGSVRVLNGLGAAYDGLQRFDVAQSFYRQAFRRDPNNPDVVNNMAISLQMAGNPEAMVWFARAEQLDPKNPVIGRNVNLAAAATGTAASTMTLASRDDPGSVQVDRPRIERASALEYQVELPTDHPTDLGTMVQPDSPRNVASVERRVSVPPIIDAANPAPPIHNVIIATPPVDDDGGPPGGRDTAGPTPPAIPTPRSGNVTSQATPLAPPAITFARSYAAAPATPTAAPRAAPAAAMADFVAATAPGPHVAQAAAQSPEGVTVFDPALLACAPNVAAGTLNAIIKVESGGNPLALHVNGTDTQPPPARDPAEAARVAESYVARGYSVDVGLMQVNTRNLAATGHTIEQALDPCTNILHGSSILSSDYERAARTHGDDPYALLAALSAYNTGDFHRGFSNGYVAHVVSGNEQRRSAPAHPVQQVAAGPRKPVDLNQRIHALRQELDRLEQEANKSNAAKLMAAGTL
jgi:type IV secretion system protein VirB1